MLLAADSAGKSVAAFPLTREEEVLLPALRATVKVAFRFVRSRISSPSTLLRCLRPKGLLLIDLPVLLVKSLIDSTPQALQLAESSLRSARGRG